MMNKTSQGVVIFALLSLILTSCSGHNGSSLAPAAPTPMTHARAQAGNPSYSGTILADAPTAYYRLDDTTSTAADSSGNALNGTVGTSVTEGVPGLIANDPDTAMTLPGLATTAGVVSVPQTNLLQPASAVSLEAWIRFTSTPATYTFVTGYGSDNTLAPYGFYFNAGGVLVAQLALTGTGNTLATDPNALAVNTTYHIVETYDGATLRLYVNGVQVASAAASGSLKNYGGGYGFAIGDDAQRVDPPFKGTVDEVAVYASKALTSTQVQTHYAAGTGGATPTPTPSMSPTPPPTPTPTPGAGYSDWSSFGDNLQRTGYNPSEGVLNKTNVAKGMHVAWATDLGGAVTAQPVLATNVVINNTPTNVVYVGAENNIFYALNADTGAIIWRNSSLGAAQVGSCHDLPGGQFGITGTATFDKAAGIIYVADASDNVHALSMTTGMEQWRTNILVDPYNNNAIVGTATQDHVYGALTLNNGVLYAYTGSFCEVAPWHGRIVAISTSTHNVTAAFFPGRTGTGTLQTAGKSGTKYCGGGIWGMGGASIDPNTNDVFVATGNVVTNSNGGCLPDANGETYPYGDAVIELDPNLNLLSAQTATYNGHKVNFFDSDYGATPMLYAVPGCGSEQSSTKNKDGFIYTYGESSVLTFEQQLQIAPITSGGQFVGVPAYDPTNHLVYVGNPSQIGNYAHGLNAFSTNGCGGLSLAWKASVGNGNQGAQDNQAPTVANGMVFFTDGIDNQLWVFDDTNGTLLWHSGTLIGSPCASYGITCGVYGAPLVDEHVYVGSFNHKLYDFSP